MIPARTIDQCYDKEHQQYHADSEKPQPEILYFPSIQYIWQFNDCNKHKILARTLKQIYGIAEGRKYHHQGEIGRNDAVRPVILLKRVDDQQIHDGVNNQIERYGKPPGGSILTLKIVRISGENRVNNRFHHAGERHDRANPGNAQHDPPLSQSLEIKKEEKAQKCCRMKCRRQKEQCRCKYSLPVFEQLISVEGDDHGNALSEDIGINRKKAAEKQAEGHSGIFRIFAKKNAEPAIHDRRHYDQKIVLISGNFSEEIIQILITDFQFRCIIKALGKMAEIPQIISGIVSNGS